MAMNAERLTDAQIQALKDAGITLSEEQEDAIRVAYLAQNQALIDEIETYLDHPE